MGCWIAALALQLALYLRPAPHGGVFLIEWQRYFWLALYYELLGVWLVCAPFLLAWLLLYRRDLRARWWRLAIAAQAILLVGYLVLSQADHEVLRFLGVRLNPSFLYAYSRPGILSDPLFRDVLGQDRGGPYVPLVLLLAIPALFGWWAYAAIGTGRAEGWRPMPLWLAIALALVPLAAPANAWLQATSQFRLRKVEPVVLAFATDIASGYAEWLRPDDFADLAADYQRRWLARNAEPGWTFPDPERPYFRVPAAAQSAPAMPRWNVIYLQLETLRGMDTGAVNPQTGLSATPYLDRLASAPNAAVWTRAASFGMPSINGLFASHCSVAPSSRRYITGYTSTALLCLPELLQRQGYRTEMFNAGDTDWDNSSPWLNQWYQRLWRFPEAAGQDRIVFRAAAAHLRRIGREPTPFFVAVVSATNHTPFRSVEPQLDIAGQDTPAQRIRNTTHYTDDVVAEFIEALRDEPWFPRTLIVVAGDHGFNLGEHGLPPGQQDLYRESVWVPLIIAGSHPDLPVGRHDNPASLLDMAPTVADLLGIEVANPWMGHSLLAVRDGEGFGFSSRTASFWESPQWSAVRDPESGAVHLYSRAADWLQRRDQAATRPALADELIGNAERAGRLNDYLLRHGLIWPGRAS